ncbi:MAG: hypothetical protein IPJ88_18290 [Myxococcales bacterium]|nr:MAG: hypothetical protein IPJ88_18290 [Myxococcales bacterium]
MRGVQLIALFSLCSYLCFCSDSADCVDSDLDGYGTHCSAGEDCDEHNALRTNNCDVVAAPNCTEDPYQTGCSCLTGTTVDCYAAEPSSMGIGPCLSGRARCIDGYLGLCLGAILPEVEVCNDIDDDCDGLVDENVISPCGGCNSSCTGAVWGGVGMEFEANDTLQLTSEGWLTLKQEILESDALWIGNTNENTVSHIDLISNTETARYPSAGNEPTRIAVDYVGDAWVANRAMQGQSTLTKYAGVIDRCIDKSNDGLQSSSGPNNVLAEAAEDCLLFSVPIGTAETPAVARAMAIDGSYGNMGQKHGDPWIGLHALEQVEQRDGETGALLQSLSIPGFAPYAAQFDRWGYLWLISQDGLLARVNRRLTPPEVTVYEVPFACYLLYGLGIDKNDHIVVSGFHCNTVMRFDPESENWELSSSPTVTRGLAATDSRLWVAHTDGRVSTYLLSDLSHEQTIDLWTAGHEPYESIGLASDPLRDTIWVISSSDNFGETGIATRIDATSLQVLAHLPVGLGPHNQGDLIGSKRSNVFVPEGQSSAVFEGCQDAQSTEWLRIHLEADAGSSGQIALSVRHADSVENLSNSTFEPVGSFPSDSFPVALDLPQGGVIEVMVRLGVTDRDGAPRLKQVGVEWSCPVGSVF